MGQYTKEKTHVSSSPRCNGCGEKIKEEGRLLCGGDFCVIARMAAEERYGE